MGSAAGDESRQRPLHSRPSRSPSCSPLLPPPQHGPPAAYPLSGDEQRGLAYAVSIAQWHTLGGWTEVALAAVAWNLQGAVLYDVDALTGACTATLEGDLATLGAGLKLVHAGPTLPVIALARLLQVLKT